MSDRYLSPVLLLFVSIIVSSFLWFAVPHANAGTPGACCEPDGACQVVMSYICDSTPGGNYQGDSTTCDPGGCLVTPTSKMCYQTNDDNTDVGTADIIVPDFLVDMNCADLGQTRLYCKPACVDIVEPTGVCDDYSGEIDLMCYRFGQCVFNNEDIPDELFVGDTLNPDGRFISQFGEHELCVPASVLPTPTPTATPTPTPSPSPTPTPVPGSEINCVSDIGNPAGCFQYSCDAGQVYACDASGNGSPSTKCVKSINKNRCCAEAQGEVGDICKFSNP